MSGNFDLYMTARLLNIMIIGAVAGITFAAAIKMEPENADKQAARLQGIIKKAAVQCYSLEGEFPEDLYYLEHYGVIFDNDRFFFHYEMNGIGNYMPDIYVIPRY